MSEPISAFAVYKAGNKKGAAAGNKSNQKKNGNSAARKNPTAARSATAQKDKPKSTAAKSQPAKEKTNNKPKAAAMNNKAATTTAAAARAATARKENSASSSKAATKKQQQQQSAANSKTPNNGIKENEIDQLVEQLLGDSSSNPKKLTKAQQKKKQQLEDYLVKQLEMDDEQQDEEEEEEESDSDSGEEESGSDSNEFTDEYTINSYSDDSEEEEEEETTCSGSFSSSSGADVAAVVAATIAATKKDKVKASTPQKRKSNEAIVENGNENATAPKKSRQPDAERAATAAAANKRKSLPATSQAGAAHSKEAKRHSIAETSTPSTSSKSNVKTVDAQAVKLEPLSPPSNVAKMNSIKEGEKAFSWLLNPLGITEFYAKYWEQAACLVRRKRSSYYSHLISFEAIDQMLLRSHVEFTKNIDITSYKNGIRETLNPEGRAMPPVVWDHYGQGCSIRLLNPQTFLPQLYTLNAIMQEYFHCLVGANAYLTPPNSQGFAPHYDDIEAFVLQIEGRKRWRLYKPRNISENLPRFSSKNFAQQEIGKPIFDEVLEPGDMLYFPRGTIHQASTEPGYHSLHITLSVYQKQSYADLFEKIMPLVLQRAIENNVEMRRGLPLHTWQHTGVAFNDNDTKERADLLKHVNKLMSHCLQSIPIAEVMDAAVDQLAKKYQHEALPPEIMPSERLRTIFGSRSTTNERGECICDYEIDERTNVRLLRAHIMRLVQEEEKLRIYYYLDNSKEYCEYEPNFIEIEAEEAASVEVLIRSYPEYIGVSQLPLEDDERKIQLVTALWERGLLMLEKPFK